MNFKQFSVFGKSRLAGALLATLAFGGCATTTPDDNFAYRNNLDAARGRCLDLARTTGYQDVAVDSVEREGQAEWKVDLVVTKDGKNRKERCGYNATTNRVRMEG
jgi:hypothetical protein